MDCKKARKEIKEYMATKGFKDFVKTIELRLGKKLSRIEKELIAIDCIACIKLSVGNVDELKKFGIEV